MAYEISNFFEDITAQLGCYDDEKGEPDSVRLQSVVASARIESLHECKRLLETARKLLPPEALLTATAIDKALADAARSPIDILIDAGEYAWDPACPVAIPVAP